MQFSELVCSSSLHCSAEVCASGARKTLWWSGAEFAVGRRQFFLSNIWYPYVTNFHFYQAVTIALTTLPVNRYSRFVLAKLMVENSSALAQPCCVCWVAQKIETVPVFRHMERPFCTCCLPPVPIWESPSEKDRDGESILGSTTLTTQPPPVTRFESSMEPPWASAICRERNQPLDPFSLLPSGSSVDWKRLVGVFEGKTFWWPRYVQT